MSQSAENIKEKANIDLPLTGQSLILHSEKSLLDFSGGVFNVRLEFFSGPMDLLLHLVSQQEVAIEKVEMAMVCKQYLDIVLRDVNKLDLERAMEYLVIAATLMAIKSGALLPANSDDALDGSFEDFDPRFFEDLRARLIAYRNTKLRAEALERLPQLGVHTFARGVRTKEFEEEYLKIDEGDPFSLSQAFMRLLKRVGGLANTLRISIESVTIVSSMMKIIDYLKTSTTSLGSRSFKSAMQEVVGGARGGKDRVQARMVILSGFLGVLELAKRGLLSLSNHAEGNGFDIALHMDTNNLEVAADEASLVNNEWDVNSVSVDTEFTDNVVHMDDYREKVEEKEELESLVCSPEEELREVVHGK